MASRWVRIPIVPHRHKGILRVEKAATPTTKLLNLATRLVYEEKVDIIH